MNKIFNKRNITILKLLAILGLAVYFIFKAIPKLDKDPSTILLSAMIIGGIGFSMALFKLGREVRNESLKDKALVVKSTRDKLIIFLNILGVILVAFLFLTNQFEFISQDTFVFIYVFAGLILVSLIILNVLKIRA